MFVSKEDKEKIEELKRKFLEVKELLKKNPEKCFPGRVCYAIEIVDEFKSIFYKDKEETTYEFSAGGNATKLTTKLYEKFSIWDKSWANIIDITDFKFLQKEEHSYSNQDAGMAAKLFQLFDDIYILDENDNQIMLFDFDDKEMKRQLSYKDILNRNIEQMYDLKELIEKKYYYYTNRKQYEDFIKKYTTITEIAKQSQKLAEEYKRTSMRCFGFAFGWFLFCEFCNFSGFSLQINDNTILMHFFENKIYQKEIFTFLSNLLFKLPSFVLCLVGVKFLYLFVNYKTEEREFSMLDSYLEKLTDCTKDKAELVRQLAPHFFPDKKANKMSQSFLQELILKLTEKIETNHVENS